MSITYVEIIVPTNEHYVRRENRVRKTRSYSRLAWFATHEALSPFLGSRNEIVEVNGV